MGCPLHGSQFRGLCRDYAVPHWNSILLSHLRLEEGALSIDRYSLEVLLGAPRVAAEDLQHSPNCHYSCSLKLFQPEEMSVSGHCVVCLGIVRYCQDCIVFRIFSNDSEPGPCSHNLCR